MLTLDRESCHIGYSEPKGIWLQTSTVLCEMYGGSRLVVHHRHLVVGNVYCNGTRGLYCTRPQSHVWSLPLEGAPPSGTPNWILIWLCAKGIIPLRYKLPGNLSFYNVTYQYIKYHFQNGSNIGSVLGVCLEGFFLVHAQLSDIELKHAAVATQFFWTVRCFTEMVWMCDVTCFPRSLRISDTHTNCNGNNLYYMSAWAHHCKSNTVLFQTYTAACM